MSITCKISNFTKRKSAVYKYIKLNDFKKWKKLVDLKFKRYIKYTRWFKITKFIQKYNKIISSKFIKKIRVQTIPYVISEY